MIENTLYVTPDNLWWLATTLCLLGLVNPRAAFFVGVLVCAFGLIGRFVLV